MSNKIQIVQKFYNLLTKTVSSKSSGIYVDDFETVKPYDFSKLNEQFLHEYELYLKTVQKQEEYLHLYNIGIKRDDKDWIENIANRVGLTVPKYNNNSN